jgi:N-acylneuraminate cytidylyltransferase/CMP-N,N'-diacetyllegionaminic acid synthase
MQKKRKLLAIIPARAGSKGLPGKNIKQLHGKPLILWTLQAAIQSGCFNKIIVSTDSVDIAKLVNGYGDYAPFLRPAELAEDKSTSYDALMHVVSILKARGEVFEAVAMLQPTSPLRIAEDIKNGVQLWNQSKQNKAIVSVCEMEHPLAWCNSLPDDMCMKDFIKQDLINKRRQDIRKSYRLNGAFYLAGIDYIQKYQGFMGPETYAYTMPQERSVDIDSQFDLDFAEYILAKQCDRV